MSHAREGYGFVSQWRFLRWNAVVWTALALLFAVQGNFSMRVPIPMYQSVGYALAAFLPCFLLTPAIVLLALRYRFADAVWPAIIAHLIGLASFLVIGGAMMGAFQWALPWADRAPPLAAAAGRAIIGYLASDVLIYAMVVAAVQAAAYGHEAGLRAVSELRLSAQLTEARLHVLSAQLQPHFLFNTLNAISALAREDPRQAERLLARLSELLRHALQLARQLDISVEEEVSFMERYVELQEARFGARLKVVFRVDPDLHDCRLPTLLLQPLVENAIRHGVAEAKGTAHIEVTVRREPREDRMRLTVRDNGGGIPTHAALREGVGLSTTRERLRQFYGDEHEFNLTNVPEGGALCTVVVPCRTKTDAI